MESKPKAPSTLAPDVQTSPRRRAVEAAAECRDRLEAERDAAVAKAEAAVAVARHALGYVTQARRDLRPIPGPGGGASYPIAYSPVVEAERALQALFGEPSEASAEYAVGAILRAERAEADAKRLRAGLEKALRISEGGSANAAERHMRDVLDGCEEESEGGTS